VNSIVVCNGVEKTKRLIHESELLIEPTTDGEGVMGMNILENEHGCIIHVESSASDIAWNVYELDGDELKSKLYLHQSCEVPDSQRLNHIQYCAGASFYAVSTEGTSNTYLRPMLTFVHLDALKVIDNTEGENINSVYWMKKCPTECQSANNSFSNIKWLDDDLLCFNVGNETQKSFGLFSIVAKAQVGSVRGDIVFVLKHNNHIVCVTRSNDCYILTKN